MRHRGTYRYIESEKGQTKTHRAREVRDRASPNHSRETDGMSGIDLTQRSEGQKSVRSGMGVGVRKRLDVRKSKGRRCVGSGMSVGVGNRLDARERKG